MAKQDIVIYASALSDVDCSEGHRHGSEIERLHLVSPHGVRSALTDVTYCLIRDRSPEDDINPN